MFIEKIISQHRRDFVAIYKCEHCEHAHESSGYDDSYFHNVVVPGMLCPNCGTKADDNSKALAPKYPEGTQI